MPETWVHGADIMDYIRDLIYDNLKTDMGLIFVSVGKLYQVASYADMSQNVPCVLVSIDDEAPVNAAEIGLDLITQYPIRIVYVRQFADSEEIEKTKANAIEKIANYLMEKRHNIGGDAGSGDMELTAGNCTNVRLMGMEYTAPEGAEEGVLNKNLVVAACTLLVEVISTGS